MRFFFSKKNRLLKAQEFRYTKRMGCIKKTPHFVLIFIPTTNYISRLGLTVSRKNGNSVRRNYIKRFLREFYRLNQHHIKNYDFVLIVKHSFNKKNSISIKNELDELFSIQ